MAEIACRIFVVGSPRSGTTLLQGLLAAHSQILAFTESHFFDKGFRKRFLSRKWQVLPTINERIRSFYPLNPVPSTCSESLLLERVSGDSATAAKSLIQFFDDCAKSENRTVWLEKTPDNVRRISLLSAAAENAVFIHIIRRPVETIMSLRKAKAQWGRPNSWLRCFAHWYSAMWCSRNCLGLSNHYFVSYEDLTEDPSRVLKYLIESLGLEWDDSIIERRIQATGALVRKNEVWKTNNFTEISSRPPVSDREVPWWLRQLLRRIRVYEQIRRFSVERLGGD